MQQAGIYRHAISPQVRGGWWQSPFFLTVFGGLLIWAAFPPLGFAPLAWLAPIPWLILATRPLPSGRRPWLQIWLGGTIQWLFLLEGIRRAHVANNLGLLALSVYLGCYLPIFIAITRAAVQRLGVSLVFAAPITWTALEVIRGRLFTGFSVGLLGHTQFEFPILLQIADLFGAYAVSFVMVAVAACAVAGFSSESPGRQWRRVPVLTGGLLLAATLAYGVYRIQSAPRQEAPSLKAALLQGTRDKIFEYNPEREAQSFNEYWDLMLRAKQERDDLDVIIWPEGAFTALGPEFIVDGPLKAPPEAKMSDHEYARRVEMGQEAFRERMRFAAERVNRSPIRGASAVGKTSLLVGAETLELFSDKRRSYNGALLIGPEGEIVDRYYKIHAVMFGEYIPFGEAFPWIYGLTPMSQGMSCGEGPARFSLKGLTLSPNICFEVTVPHLIREAQMPDHDSQLAADLLVNLSDDGWFWGSTVLDLQLACAVFRSIETRRPMLIAANTGISAWIDGNGRIVERSPKRKPDIIYADVTLDGRSTIYYLWGDLPGWLCVAVSTAWIALAYRRRGTLTETPAHRRRERQRPS